MEYYNSPRKYENATGKRFTRVCDNLLLELYNDSEMESIDINYDEFDSYMCELLV